MSILQPSETQKEGEAALSLDTGKLHEEPQIHIHQNSQYGLPIESNHKKFSPTLWAKTLSRSTWSGTVQWGFGFRWIPGAFTGGDGARLLPQQPHTNEDLSIEVVGRVPQDALLQEHEKGVNQSTGFKTARLCHRGMNIQSYSRYFAIGQSMRF